MFELIMMIFGTFFFVGLLFGFVDCIDPGHSPNLVTSRKDVASLFIVGHQILQKEISWGRIFRQSQVLFNDLAEIIQKV